MTTDPLASALSSPHDGAPTPAVGPRLAPLPAAVQCDPRAEEHDACALIANIRKKGQASHGNVKRTIEALMRMSHRSGVVEGEGDGCGVLTDGPRRIWARRLVGAGLFEAVAEHPRFFGGHCRVPRTEASEQLRQVIDQKLQAAGADILISANGEVVSQALGPAGSGEEPALWQVAGYFKEGSTDEVNRRLFDVHMQIERDTRVHVVSLSADSAVYKIRGSAEALMRYYPELRHPEFLSAVTVGHNRYSTNTASAFERVQPFTILGHNGEINTIAKLRDEARAIGAQLHEGDSDSQDLNRLVETLIHRYGMTLMEAVEMIFPPIVNEIKQLPPALQDLYMFFRQVWGPFSQGPAAIVSRYRDECVFAVDAMGLRPLWYGETEKEIFFSSEKGVIPMDAMVADPEPLAPGERIAVEIERGHRVRVLRHPEIQRRADEQARHRWPGIRKYRQHVEGPVTTRASRRHERYYREYLFGQHRRAVQKEEQAVLTASGPGAVAARKPGSAPARAGDATRPGDAATSGDETTRAPERGPLSLRERLYAAYGWDKDDIDTAEKLAATGNEKIGSLGHDGPLAAMSDQRVNLSDFFKEAVAVVTNPAIDREREIEHFSLRVVLGRRPQMTTGKQVRRHKRMELLHP